MEVSTFRKQAPPEEGDPLIRRDNTFGTPEEDAFRRDFTVNALFYDIADFSVIDYVDGLKDLESRLIRTIGDPGLRLREDPVRMLRAVALAARLGFTIDRDTLEAIRFLRGEIVKSSPARILEEIYKILRQGASRKTFEMLHEVGLLAYLLPEADQAIVEQGEVLLGSLSRLDDYRNAGLATPARAHEPAAHGDAARPPGGAPSAAPPPPHRTARRGSTRASRRTTGSTCRRRSRPLAARRRRSRPARSGRPRAALRPPGRRPAAPRARRAEPPPRGRTRSPRVKQLLAGRGYLEEALRWMEIHGGVQGRELAAHWRTLDMTDLPPVPAGETTEGGRAPASPLAGGAAGVRADASRRAPPASATATPAEGAGAPRGRGRPSRVRRACPAGTRAGARHPQVVRASLPSRPRSCS